MLNNKRLSVGSVAKPGGWKSLYFIYVYIISLFFDIHSPIYKLEEVLCVSRLWSAGCFGGNRG